MKPINRSAMHSSNHTQQLEIGPVVAKIKGITNKLGTRYADSNIALYNKKNLQLVCVTKPNSSGEYGFYGLNTNLKTFLIAFDNKKQFNAVIQDSVVPK